MLFLCYMYSMLRFSKTLMVGLGLLLLSSNAMAEPSADQILSAVRESMVSQGERDVLGKIRKASLQVPFSLSARGETIIFQFKENDAWQRFDAQIKQRNVNLLKVAGGKAVEMSASDYAKSIAGTDVTYEDLSMRFLYWTGGRLIDDSQNSRIKGRDCYIVEVANPQKNVGQYAWVRMWLDKENGTTWRIDGYGADGQLKKRFSITSVQKLSDGTWFFKQMKMEVRDPNNQNRTIALDYLEMDDLPDAK